MQALHAIYEHGIFRPTEPVNLPELCEVEIVVKSLPNIVKPLTLALLAELGRCNPDLPENVQQKTLASAIQRLEKLRGKMIVGDILTSIDEEWTGDTNNL